MSTEACPSPTTRYNERFMHTDNFRIFQFKKKTAPYAPRLIMLMKRNYTRVGAVDTPSSKTMRLIYKYDKAPLTST